MSLRRKIIFLFGLFAVVPLLAVAGLAYWQAQGLLLGMVREQAEEAARVTAEDLAGKRRTINAELSLLSRRLPASPSDGAGWDPDPESSADSLLALAAYIGSRDATGSIQPFFGSIPEVQTRCINGRGSRLVRFAIPVESGPDMHAIEAGYWVSDLVGHRGLGDERRILKVEGADGSALLTTGCGLDATGVLQQGSRVAQNGEALITGGAGTTTASSQPGQWKRAVATSEDLGWEVTGIASASDALSPLRRLTIVYWIFILGLSGSTALAFSLMLGRFTRSLSELVRAAEEIGTGELDPWLPVPDSGELGQLTLAFSRMLDRIRENMRHVDQSGRLAVVGQMSAYLAHEIRNPLSSIKMNLQRLLRWTRAGELPDYCKEPLDISLKEVERLNASVTGVLQMSRAGEGPREVVGLHDVLGEATELVTSRFEKQGVGLSLELDANADFVLARPGQLKSVALNLMMNALEAQPNGGHLSIRTSLVGSPELDGPAVSIHFKDQGPGVPFGLRDRIFEPFFTAKDGGSGIGLAMARQAVEDSGGELMLTPSFPPDVGAEFVMVFPLASFDSTHFPSPPTEARYSTSSVQSSPVDYHTHRDGPGSTEGGRRAGSPPSIQNRKSEGVATGEDIR